MAKGPSAAVTAPKVSPTMLALLVSIMQSDNGALMLTQAEGNDIVNAGLATVDTATLNSDGKASVTLTEAGSKAIEAAQITDKAIVTQAAKPVFTMRSDIVMPVKVRKTKAAIYPLDSMNVGDSFHIPATAENPDPATRIASTLSQARVKYMVKSETETETVTVKNYVKDADGKITVDADGHRVYNGTSEVTRPKQVVGRDFVAAPVDASDPEGVGARVWRTV